MENRMPKPGEKYIHFKKKPYQVICVANHSETGEKMVVYQALYGEFPFYVRPLEMFISEVDHIKYPDADQKYRFELADHIRQNAPEDVQAKDLNINLHHIKIMDLNGEEHAPKVQDVVTEQNDSIGQSEDIQQEAQADPALLEFLDADSYEQKRNVLVSIRQRITDRLIDDFAVTIDVVIPEGDIDGRYQQLDTCLRTMQRYESDRLR